MRTEGLETLYHHERLKELGRFCIEKKELWGIHRYSLLHIQKMTQKPVCIRFPFNIPGFFIEKQPRTNLSFRVQIVIYVMY